MRTNPIFVIALTGLVAASCGGGDEGNSKPSTGGNGGTSVSGGRNNAGGAAGTITVGSLSSGGVDGPTSGGTATLGGGTSSGTGGTGAKGGTGGTGAKGGSGGTGAKGGSGGTGAKGGSGGTGAKGGSGGSSQTGGAGGATIGGTGGNSIGGASFTGGSGGQVSSGGTTGGGTSIGGTSGGSNTGGVGPNDPSCPSAKPAQDATCTGSLACSYYGPVHCTCSAGKWSCQGDECPAAAPEPLATCTGTKACRYGSAVYFCPDGPAYPPLTSPIFWEKIGTASQCPAVSPFSGTICGLGTDNRKDKASLNRPCAYSDQICTCNAVHLMNNDGTLKLIGYEPCNIRNPNPAPDCKDTNGSGFWGCLPRAACPATEPQPGGNCAPGSALSASLCEYPNATCTCDAAGKWVCL